MYRMLNKAARSRDITSIVPPNKLCLCLRLHLSRQGVPIATQVFTINEKWVLVKFLKRYFSFLCVILASDIVSYKI